MRSDKLAGLSDFRLLTCSRLASGRDALFMHAFHRFLQTLESPLLLGQIRSYRSRYNCGMEPVHVRMEGGKAKSIFNRWRRLGLRKAGAQGGDAVS